MTRRKTKKNGSNRKSASTSARSARTRTSSATAGRTPTTGSSAPSWTFTDLRSLWHRARTENRPARIGLGLSLLQLTGHLSWVILTTWAVQTGRAGSLSSSSPLAWTIVLMMGTSLLLTLVSLFVCLYYGLRQEPRLFAIIGLMLSFFTGTFATFAALMA